jgi:hypothetical protein
MVDPEGVGKTELKGPTAEFVVDGGSMVPSMVKVVSEVNDALTLK